MLIHILVCFKSEVRKEGSLLDVCITQTTVSLETILNNLRCSPIASMNVWRTNLNWGRSYRPKTTGK